MWHGPVVGTGQDEWYNVVRALRVLYEHLNPGYFIHPALYYELLASAFAALQWGRPTSLPESFLSDQNAFLDLARDVSLTCGVAAVAAGAALAESIAGLGAGLVAGVFVACLPLAQTLGVSIRVDALGLATMLFAASRIVRLAEMRDRRPWIAAVAVGAATAANYPGALLLGPLWWIIGGSKGRFDDPDVWRSIVRVGAIALMTFLLLNPYTVLDARQFASWFSFLSGITAEAHPHAPPASVWTYVRLLVAQGSPAVVACALGVAALRAPARSVRALAAMGIVQFVAFSFMRSQYDRFGLPPIALLGVVGIAYSFSLSLRVVGHAATGLVSLALAATLGRYGQIQGRAFQPFENAAGDYRATMVRWIEGNVSSQARLVFESDTLPVVQIAYEPSAAVGSFAAELRRAFEVRHPRFPRDVLKAQFIAAIYNYSPELLVPGGVYFLASTQNRRPIVESRALFPEPAAFYDALAARADVVFEARGFHEDLVLYRTR